MKKLVLILTFILVQVFLFGGTAESLLKPQNNAYDFTYNTNTNLNTYQATQYANKVEMQVDKILGIVPRLNKIFDCKNDAYGNTYCPEALEIAGNYTAYKASTAFERTGSVTDYEKGNWKENTGTVRDFMDGFASSHASNVTDYQSGWGTANVGTVVDYQSNSTASTYTGSVVDYTSKVSSGVTLSENSYTPVLQKPLKNNTQNNQVIVGFEHRSTGNTGHNVSPFTTAGVVQMNGEAVDYSGLSGYSRSGWGWSSSVNMFNITKPASIEGMPTLVYDQNLIGGDDGIATCSSFSNSILEPTLNSLMSNKYLIVMYKIGTTEKVSGGYWENGQCKVNVKAYQATTVSNSGYFIIKGIQVTGRGYITKNIVADNINVYTSGGKFYLNGVQFTGPVVGGYFNDVYITVDFQYVGDIAYNACPGTDMLFSGKCVSQHLTSSPPSCPDTYQDNGTNCQKTVSYNYYSYGCPSTYTPVNSGFTSYSKSDPDTSNINDYSLDDAVNSATPPPSNCKKTITYSYYKYNCPTGYTINDNGLTSACPRTDPNNTTYDEASLSQPCNNATPPDGNCTKIIPYTYYSYECSTGYTAIDKGLATCSKADSSTSTDTSSTLSQACNNSTPPPSNCYKDVNYKFYSYGCADGYITDNYGLSTCPKTDPDKSKNNTDSLDDACNSSTPPDGNCRKSYSYKYYEYQCSGTNSFNEQWKPLNSGLTSCTKSDTNINAVNTDLATACNSSTAPVNNCASTEYSCNSAIFKPAFVDGNWKCSPFYCNSDKKCGYGSCDTFSVTDVFMPTSSNPLKSELISATSACSSTYEYSDGNVTTHYIKYCTTGQIDNAVCLEKDASNKCIKFETTNASAKCMLNGTAYEPSKQYTYYTYSCNTDKNTFGNSWELINNITSDPGCIDDTFGGCISFDKLSNSCKRKTLGCSNGGTCQFNSSVSQWQCMTGSVTVSNTTCTGKICDLVLNKNISYCANESCPTVNGIYEKNNKCYIMTCPDGTFEQNGLCVVK